MRLCEYPGCGRPWRAVRYCHSHYRMHRLGQELRPLKTYVYYPTPGPGKKICTRCDRVLDALTDFYDRGNGKPQAWCKECRKKNMRDRYQEASG